jgi:N-methylhydantoinase B
MPANAGLLRPIDLDTRPGSLVDAVYPAGVSAGNVETSQRLVDLVFAAFAALGLDMPAASQGTMNNVLFGGLRPDGTPFVHYETLGGGAGARPGRPGLSGRQVHMTNTLNTPVEALERAFPVRVRRYALRDAPAPVPGTTSGGRGVVREYEFLTPAEVTVLAERRRLPPPGLRGAPPGLLGRHTLVRSSGEHLPIGGKITFDALPRDRLIIETPGGGSAPQPLTDAEAPCSEP